MQGVRHHGEYRVRTNGIVFEGKDRISVKRRALEYWYRHIMSRGVPLRLFVARCRLSADERMIVFSPAGGRSYIG